MDNRHADGIAIAREAQKGYPKDPAAFVLEGDLESNRKNWDAAATAFRAALQRGKTAENAIKLHAALQAGGKTAEAERVSTEWLKEFPKDGAFRYYLGDLALAQKDFVRAEQLYRAVLEVQPNNALALNNVAWLMVKQGKPGAVALAEKADAMMPNRAPLLDTLATALEADNQLPKAIEVQKRAIALAPKDGTLTLRLAQLFIKQGDKPRARAELESLAKQGDKFPAQAEVAALLKSL
jgi:predicted Zn-dependent protease